MNGLIYRKSYNKHNINKLGNSNKYIIAERKNYVRGKFSLCYCVN